MLNVTMEVNTIQLQHLFRALDDVVTRTRYHFIENGGAFNRRCAAQYTTKVVEGITSQRYAAGYREYKVRYARWKERMGLGNEGYWKLKGDLLRNLSHYQAESGWFGGITKGAMDSGGKSWFTKPGGRVWGKSKPISMYAYVLEWGGDYGAGGFHFERPLFVPVMEDFAETTWIEEANIALESIGRQWA